MRGETLPSFPRSCIVSQETSSNYAITPPKSDIALVPLAELFDDAA
jgi:hypothetical protein